MSLMRLPALAAGPKSHPTAAQICMGFSSSASHRASAPSNEPQTNPDILYTGVSWTISSSPFVGSFVRYAASIVVEFLHEFCCFRHFVRYASSRACVGWASIKLTLIRHFIRIRDECLCCCFYAGGVGQCPRRTHTRTRTRARTISSTQPYVRSHSPSYAWIILF